MDVNSILSQIFSNDDLSKIVSETGVSEGDTKKVLSSALNLVAGTTTTRGFDMSSLASLAGGDSGSIITSLLGAGGAQTVAQQTGVSQAGTNGILAAAAPTLLSALTGSGGSNILSLLGGLVGGNTGGSDNIIETVTQAATGTAATGNAKKKKSGILGILGKLFGGK